ncbi:hypothetical protein [Spiroplasma endosymbiont of Villa modesta]|uniref:hypothetical protein n=1 Tax=Spiroplasma endosymbiont of Villa modesta TaxID=3066293 RepID=UPI00313F2FFC
MNKEELEQWVHNEIGKISSIKEDKQTHKNCINKEKLINSIKEQIQDELDKGDNGIPYIEALDLIKDLENDEFD